MFFGFASAAHMIKRPLMKNLSAVTKKSHVALFIASLSLCCASAAMAANQPSTEGAKANNYIHFGLGNPYLPLWEHEPDGEPRVFEDPDHPGNSAFTLLDPTM